MNDPGAQAFAYLAQVLARDSPLPKDAPAQSGQLLASTDATSINERETTP